MKTNSFNDGFYIDVSLDKYNQIGRAFLENTKIGSSAEELGMNTLFISAGGANTLPLNFYVHNVKICELKVCPTSVRK